MVEGVVKGKICIGCKEFKLFKDFNPNRGFLQPRCKICSSLYTRENQMKLVVAWEPTILEIYEEFRCQCCGVKLKWYLSGDGSDAVHFDHRVGDEPINKPANFIKTTTPTDEKIALFESCDFGMVCRRCNKLLGPPEGRKERWIQQGEYINRGPI